MHFIGNEWDQILEDVFSTKEYIELEKFLEAEYASKVIYPKKENIFNSLKLTPYSECRVVIIGQDPYHGLGEAHGLSFSVRENVKMPPSLQNIFKELNQDLGLPIPTHGNLEKWAKEGVLLLNASLTVRAHMAASHAKIGWQRFTDAAIKALSDNRENLVFILWGNYAIAKENLIDHSKHLILKTVHPSPLSASRGFFGCKHFSKTNEYLINNNIKPIDWSL